MAEFTIPLSRVALAPVSGTVTLKVRVYQDGGVSTTGTYSLSAAQSLRTVVNSVFTLANDDVWRSIEQVSIEPSNAIYYNGGASVDGTSVTNAPSTNDAQISGVQEVRFP
jgi:hypothetical protein